MKTEAINEFLKKSNVKNYPFFKNFKQITCFTKTNSIKSRVL